MALTRKQKEERVAQVEKDLTGATAVVFAAYDALSVEQSETLRSQLHEQGAKMRVVPKRLLRLVTKAIELNFDPTTISGQVAVVWGSDAVFPAKTVFDFAKNESIRLVAGTLDGALLTTEQVTALAQLPSREQLLAQLVGTMVGPIRGLQTVFTGAQRQLVQVLAAVADQKQSV